MKKGDLIELDITGYAFEGKGVAKIIKEIHTQDETAARKFVVFVDGSYPGDKVIAQIRKVRSSYAEAKVKDLLEKSPLRIKANCKYFGVCGGCKAQDLDYKEQTGFKEEQVKDIFERIGGFRDFEIEPIIPARKIFYYRNKMEYSFAEKRWLSEIEIGSMQEIEDKAFALGLHIPGMYDKVLDIDGCWLQSELSNGILNFTRDFFKKRQILPYSAQKHTGFLRNLVIKQSFLKNDLMVNLVVADENERLFINYKNDLLERFPEVTTLVYNINRKLSQVAYGDYEIVTHGSGFIHDLIGEWKFRISANSFFQTNTGQAEYLFNTALEYADFKGDEIVFDLYSGAGTIPIFISKYVKYIYGFESVEPAVEDAKVNIGLNSIKNFEPVLADLNKSFLPLINERGIPAPDVIIADPPRSGMNPKTVKDILELMPKKIVYISCNPATQARDINLLCGGGYKLIKLRPVDMFPHTYHIENVAVLHRD
ncbi:MAG: 23S rRNA (uracil(1939)-C(5))-methyltransferase RlmD [Ignavibacteriae bacterium HGW-Ignavibacteriae-3]|nr:MAG: 23S rRNA (uracil(1939)-C(5))-methyltransferase RlmD [Ignavibacteriae bacterium HGW-Ignavibacteriae-3]